MTASRRYSRRGLFAAVAGSSEPIRPPWTLPLDRFEDLCTGCDGCIRACPTGILKRGRGGLPYVDFSQGECTFCGQCREACRDDCFLSDRAAAPWHVQAEISEACVERKGVSCRMCQDVCMSDAIRARPMTGGRANLSINTELCTGCGACVVPCPVGAVTLQNLEQQELVP